MLYGRHVSVKVEFNCYCCVDVFLVFFFYFVPKYFKMFSFLAVICGFFQTTFYNVFLFSFRKLLLATSLSPSIAKKKLLQGQQKIRRQNGKIFS